MIAQERLYLTVDRRRIVEQGHKDAAFLLCCQGNTVPKEYRDMVDDGKVIKDAKPKESAPVANKESRPVKNKEIKFGNNK